MLQLHYDNVTYNYKILLSCLKKLKLASIACITFLLYNFILSVISSLWSSYAIYSKDLVLDHIYNIATLNFSLTYTSVKLNQVRIGNLG